MRYSLKDIITCGEGELSVRPAGADAIVGQHCQGERG